MSEILTSRRAFALDRYQEADTFNKKALERDTAALVLETSGEIHEFLLAILPDGTVVNPALSKTKDVKNFYDDKTPESALEKIAGLKIRQALVNEPIGTLVFWISPPGGDCNHKGATFEIGRIREVLDIKVMQTYGVPLSGVTGEFCERVFLMLEEFSIKDPQIVNCPNDLRDKISILTMQGNSGAQAIESHWTTFLSGVFPELSEIFTKIKNGEVHRIRMKALKNAKEVVNDAFDGWARPQENLIYTGAVIERGMEAKGWNLSGGRCGILNSDLLRTQTFFQNKAMFGMVEIKGYTGEKKNLHCKCPVTESCGMVDAEIYDGKIHCPKCGAEAMYTC